MRRRAILAVVLSACAAASLRADTPAPRQNVVGISMEDCRRHLGELVAVTEKCAKGRDKQSCDPESIGADDNLTMGRETRVIRYDWLRALFVRAQEPDRTQRAAGALGSAQLENDSTLPKPKTTTQLLQAALARLAQDLAQTNAPLETVPAHAAESSAMQKVLDGHEFRKLKGPGPAESLAEKINDWLNRFFAGLSGLTRGAAWLGRALVWGFMLAVGIGLVWALLQLERRWRVRLVPAADAPPRDAASARDWQLWLADARRAAAAGQWREAIHFLYWAAISRLESKRLWPADRARTPREYLALVTPEDPRKAGLAALTGSFERTWYGGRAAGEADYQRADELAGALIGAGAAGAGRAEGGQAR